MSKSIHFKGRTFSAIVDMEFVEVYRLQTHKACYYIEQIRKHERHAFCLHAGAFDCMTLDALADMLAHDDSDEVEPRMNQE